MLLKCIKGGIAGGLILFVWGFVSWMLIPWHAATMSNFKNEAAVIKVIKANTIQSGIYILPSMTSNNLNPNTETPMIFASVKLEGMTSMTMGMMTQLLIEIAAAFFVTCLLTHTSGLNYKKRVLFVVVFALASSIAIDLCYWNWFCFDTKYTLVSMADGLIGWFLAGLALAKITGKK